MMMMDKCSSKSTTIRYCICFITLFVLLLIIIFWNQNDTHNDIIIIDGYHHPSTSLQQLGEHNTTTIIPNNRIPSLDRLVKKDNSKTQPDLSFALNTTQSNERLQLLLIHDNKTNDPSADFFEADNDEGTTNDDEKTTNDDSVIANKAMIIGSSSSSLDDGQQQLCSREKMIDGKWVRDTLSKPPYITPTVHLRCYDKNIYDDKKHGWKTWKWLPTAKNDKKCYFNSHFDKKEFCNNMRHAVVSIIGDSLSWEHYSSLVQLNGIQTHQGYQHQSRELNTNIYQSVCNGYTKILYKRDDKLQNISSSIIQNFPIVLILNRGAHYVPDDELMIDIRHNIKELNEHWISKCIQYKLKCHLFWRTSVPGHPGCSIEKSTNSNSKVQLMNAYTEPVNDIQQMEDIISNLSNYNNKTINYHWYDYQHQNQLIIKELMNAFGNLSTNTNIHFEIIDGYYLNVRRPDEHRAHQVRMFCFDLFFVCLLKYCYLLIYIIFLYFK